MRCLEVTNALCVEETEEAILDGALCVEDSKKRNNHFAIAVLP